MLAKTDKVHLIGIGGYGMSALAKLLLEMGYSVSGSDLAPSDITRHLEELGAEISIGHHAGNVRGRDVVIYSTAIPEENDELRAGKEVGKVLHRSELLAEFINSGIGIAVTGAHGKTTTTTMLARIMERGGLDPTALIGGEIQDFSGTARLGKSNYVVAEADESDQSFSRYRPRYAVITNIEADHLEHYNGSFLELLEGYGIFAANIHAEGLLIIPKEDKWIGEILSRSRCRKITFGIGSGDYRADNLTLNALGSQFLLFRGRENLGEVSLNVPGRHNILNALAAAAMALELGVGIAALKEALATFEGAKRRFQILAKHPFMVIDDYAHHPTEIKATLDTAKSIDGGRVVAIFQPHRYTRTKYFMEDFANSFAAADVVLIDDIFAASEQPLPDISAEALAKKTAACHHGLVQYLSGRKAIINWVKHHWRPGDIFLTMGAGDISRVGGELALFCEQYLAGKGLVKVE